MSDRMGALPLACVVLAGGKSRRMGQPKESLRMPGGLTLLEHMVGLLSPFSRVLIVSGKSRGDDLPMYRQGPELVALPDSLPGEGPLAAMATILGSGIASRYLVVGCDQARLTRSLLERLVRSAAGPEQPVFFRSVSGEELDPLPGIIPAGLHACVRSSVDSGSRRLRDLTTMHPPLWVTLEVSEERALQSLNTPEDWAQYVRECEGEAPV